MTQATPADLTSTGLLARVLTRVESNIVMRARITSWLAVTITLTMGHSAFAELAPCRQMVHERNAYTVCEVDLRKRDVRLFWKRPDGAPYAYLSALPRSLDGELGKISFAINAGMFDPALKPVGLYIEQGRELVHANTNAGYGNFHWKPNGVFFVAGGIAGVLETGAYLRQRPHVDMATQSGPMLVINGRLHPRFDRNSSSLKVRSGVGIADAHTIVFAISDSEVSFAAFARLFRDALRCGNALFLDGGSAPSLYAPLLKRSGNTLSLGPMLGIFEKADTGRSH
jgi:uncharacterized protein YigE (DUF2233 family)